MKGERRSVSLPLFVIFGIAATGGPLALAALYIPSAQSATSSEFVTVIAVLVFAVPVAVWYRFSQHIASSGGLFSFVEAAVGRRVALVQGAVWIISYFLYLPYTIVYIVYYLLPVVFPGIGGLRPFLVIVLTLAIAGLAFLPLRLALFVVAGLVCAQLSVLVAMSAAGAAHVGVATGAFAAHGSVARLTKRTLGVSLLYVCTSLPLFLGGETTEGRATVRKGLVGGFAIAAAFVVVGTLPWARASGSIITSPIPGVALARAAWGHGFATVVGLGVAASIAGVVIAEYFALNRLVHAITRRALRATSVWVAAGFLVSSLLSLIDPEAFYSDLVTPSLIALWVSQLIVFLVYPRLAKAHAQLGPLTLLLSAGAAGLMGYGLYQGVTAVTT